MLSLMSNQKKKEGLCANICTKYLPSTNHLLTCGKAIFWPINTPHGRPHPSHFSLLILLILSLISLSPSHLKPKRRKKEKEEEEEEEKKGTATRAVLGQSLISFFSLIYALLSCLSMCLIWCLIFAQLEKLAKERRRSFKGARSILLAFKGKEMFKSWNDQD